MHHRQNFARKARNPPLRDCSTKRRRLRSAPFSAFENVQTSMLTRCLSLAIQLEDRRRSHACPQATQINAASMHVTVTEIARHAASPVG